MYVRSYKIRQQESWKPSKTELKGEQTLQCV